MNRLLFSAGMVAFMTVPRVVADTLPINVWEPFTWNDGGTVPASTSPTEWDFTTSTNTQLQITDAFFIGDQFSVLIAGTTNASFDTSAINPAVDGQDGPGVDGPSSWADPDYSQAAFNLGPGTYKVTIDIIGNAPGFVSGEGFIQDAQLVPEPRGTAILLAVILGAALLLRNRLSA